MSKPSRGTSLLIVCLACAGALAPAPAAEEKATEKSILAEQMQVCEEAIKQMDETMLATLLSKPDDAHFDIWMRRWIRLIQDSEMKTPERITALEKMVALAKKHEELARRMIKAGQATKSMELATRFRRLEFELALAHETAR